jgi:hypothetical protein
MLEVVTGVAAPNRTPLRFEQGEPYLTGIEQQSAIAFVSSELGFVIAGDDSSAVWLVKPRRRNLAKTRLRKDDGQLNGIEGICFERATSSVRVLSENSRRVWEMRLGVRKNKVRLSDPTEIGKIEKIGKKKNKGLEGLALLPAAVSPNRTKYQLAINEDKPRRVAFIDPKTLEVKGLAELPESLRAVLPDLSDLAVSSSGTLFLLSDEGNALAELAIRKIDSRLSRGRSLPQWTLVPLHTTEIDTRSLPLAGAERLQPEGLSFDHRGNL